MPELSKRGLFDGQRTSKLKFCEALESRKRIDLLKEEHNTKGTLEYIHSDLWESVMVPSKGCAYYPLLIDNFFKKSLGILVETDE